jgi:predicted small lipoprotein YifL
MMKSNLTRAVVLVATTALVTVVAGCGNKGPLVPPKALAPTNLHPLIK